ncbi:DMT family transporter [Paraburkholderia sp. 22B1P]|uniref:DMT family transporter n=1 Tax=Paraburkholderia sp. 22B1P TaxID=3080498 RepID=UPI0030935F82|nr:DMT family transporter [Paraburkholderia sp. 22B1P]
MASGKVSVAATVDSERAQRGASRIHVAGFAWAALTVMIFSGWFVVTRFGVTRELRIWDIAALRFGIGAILLAPAVARRGCHLPVARWGEGLIFAVLWGMPFVLLVAFGLKLTSAAQAASVAPTLMPVFAGVFAWCFLRERQGRVRWLGYAAIITGLVCLLGAGAAVHGAPDIRGIAALTAAAAMWAVYTLLFRRSVLTPIQSAALICIWSTAVYLPAYLFLGLSRFSLASPGEIALQALYQGVLMSGVALITYNRAVSLLGSSAATAVIALLPAIASIFAIPVLGETPSRAEWMSIVVIVLGVLLASRPLPERRASTCS